MPEITNVNDILNLMKESNKTFDSTVYVPSLNKEIHVKPMNASHLKSIIKTAVSGVFANNVFNQTVFVILKEILDPSVSTTVITNFDKVAILIQLRKCNGKNDIDVEVTSKDEKIEKKVSFGLDKIINKIKKGKFSFVEETIVDGPYTVTLAYPSIEQEFLFDLHFETTRIKKIDETDKAALKELFGPLFIQELAQYVTHIKINEQEINLLALKVEERLAVVESLSSSIITQIIEKIDAVFGKQINDLLRVTTTENGDKLEGAIAINPTLFT